MAKIKNERTTQVRAHIPIDDYILIQDICKHNKLSFGKALIRLLSTSTQWLELKDREKYAKSRRKLDL
jgi:hypothetical protein